VAVLSTSLVREGALAEVAFYWSQLTPLPTKPAVLHRLRIATRRTLQLILADLETLGVMPTDYTRINNPRTQAIGAAIAFLGCDGLMMAVAFLSLLVNANVLRMLGRYREGEVHLRATWIFTRVDVIANVGVMLSGLVVLLTGSRFPDLFMGSAIGVYVVKEAFEILSEAREAMA
jgi:hypothetical protein